MNGIALYHFLLFEHDDGTIERKRGKTIRSRWQVFLSKLMDHTLFLKNKAVGYLTCTVITLDILLSINTKGQINVTIFSNYVPNVFFKLVIKILNYYCSKLADLIWIQIL